MEAAVAMDFNALSRRELQALCKLNGVRANMTNAAMAEALQSLPSVDGIDRIGTTLCLPTPGKSAMKSVLKAEAAFGEDQQQQQHGSPLPRGRRVSVKSPEAIRMDVEDGEDEMRRDLIKDIVRTPGVALRSTSRRQQATPAPIPTPAAGTLRRSQRSAARKAAAPVEVEVSNTERTTRRTARSKVMIDLDQEEEAPEEEKVQEVEPTGLASDEKCDNPEEEQVTEHLEEGNSKAEEPEQDEEVVSSVAPIGSVDRSFNVSKVEEVEEKATKPQEEAALEEELDIVSVEKSAPLAAMEDSPILGVPSKVETMEPAIKNTEDASTGYGEDFGNWSPVLEITDEINRASEEKKVAAVEVPKEEALNSTHDAVDGPNKMLPAAVADTETEEEDVLNQEKEVAAVEVPKEEALNSTHEAVDAPNKMLPAAVTEEEDELSEEKEVAADEIPQADLTDDESAKEYKEISEEDDMDEEEDDMQKTDLAVDAATGETVSVSETDDESDGIIEGSDSTDVNFDSDEEEEVPNEVDESDVTGEEDDFSADLSPEFEKAGNFSDSNPAVLEGIHAAATSSAAKTVKPPDDSAITEELEVSSKVDEVSQQAAVSEDWESIMKSLDEFTFTEGKKESEAMGGGAKEKKKKQLKAEKNMSRRKLEAMLKEQLIAAEEKKRLAFAEKNDNTGVDC